MKFEFLNQSSLSILKSITLSSQSPGHISVTWDGHADNGVLVAPGNYTVTVTVTDAIGNVIIQPTLMVVQY